MTDSESMERSLAAAFPRGRLGGRRCSMTAVVLVLSDDATKGRKGAKLREHLASCEECRSARASLTEGVPAAPAPRMPRALADRVASARREFARAQLRRVLGPESESLLDEPAAGLPMAASRGRAMESGPGKLPLTRRKATRKKATPKKATPKKATRKKATKVPAAKASGRRPAAKSPRTQRPRKP